MKLYVITVTQLSTVLDEDDANENPTGTYVLRAESEDFALDAFHSTIPISVLDDFDIECVEAKELVFNNENTLETCEDVQHLVLEEIESTFTEEEILDFESFEEFWGVIDAQNAFEEEWKSWTGKGIKQTYEKFYNEILKGEHYAN